MLLPKHATYNFFTCSYGTLCYQKNDFLQLESSCNRIKTYYLAHPNVKHYVFKDEPGEVNASQERLLLTSI